MSLQIRPRVKCKDGTLWSIQASKYHYCTPRTDEGPHTHFEVCSFGQEVPESWKVYDAGEGIYDRVPLELIEALVEEHGGHGGVVPGSVEV